MLLVEDLLNIKELEGISVVAGKMGLKRNISSVTVLEISDQPLKKWLKKDQLLISSFYSIYDKVEKQEALIEEVVSEGCCGLILCNVDWLMEGVIPDRLINICDKFDFPLLRISDDFAYYDIIEPIMSKIPDAKYSNFFNANTTTSSFIDLVINEDRVEKVLQKMNQKIKLPVSYYDSQGRCIYSELDDEEAFAEREYIATHLNRVLSSKEYEGQSLHTVGEVEKQICVVKTSFDVVGIIVVNTRDIDSKFAMNVLESLKIACSLLFMKRERISTYRNRIRQEFVTDLLIWNFVSNESALGRGEDISCPISEINRIVVVNINSLYGGNRRYFSADEMNIVKQDLLPKIERLIQEYNSRNWCTLQSDMIIIFLDTKTSSFKINSFLGRLEKTIGAIGDLSFSIGVSAEMLNYRQIPVAYNQAFDAAIVGRSYYGENRAVFSDQIFFFKQLVDLSRNPDAQEATRRFLAPITEYDEKHGTFLLETMRSLLENQCNIKKTSTELFAHRNTILQRKEKITELLGFSPFEMPHLLNYLIAFGIYNYK